MGAAAGRGWGAERGGDRGALAAGTVVCGAMEVRLVNAMVRLKIMTSFAPVALAAHLIRLTD